MADTKSGIESIQMCLGHVVPKRKETHQRLLIISKGQKSQHERAPIGRGHKLSIK